MEAGNLQMRRAKTLEDYEACVRIQQEVWNFTHAHDHASVPLLRVQNRYGGSVLVAENPEGQIQGFAYALLCRDEGGDLFWWSHMTAVREPVQNTGIGFGLKRCQRSEALR